jgi:hypothetical protein
MSDTDLAPEANEVNLDAAAAALGDIETPVADPFDGDPFADDASALSGVDEPTLSAEVPAEPQAEAVPAEVEASKPKRSRENALPKGGLEAECVTVCNNLLSGVLVVEGPWTPARISSAIHASRGGVGNPPSSGAITDNLRRWRTIGYAVVEEEPTRFIAFTDDAHNIGLGGLKERAAANKKAVRDAIRAERKAAAKAAVETVTAPQPAEAPAEAPEDPIGSVQVVETANPYANAPVEAEPIETPF